MHDLDLLGLRQEQEAPECEDQLWEKSVSW